jgi:hypothetical protein
MNEENVFILGTIMEASCLVFVVVLLVVATFFFLAHFSCCLIRWLASIDEKAYW